MFKDVLPGLVSKEEFPLPERSKVFARNCVYFVGTQAADLASTGFIISRGLDTEGNNLFEHIHPLLSPKYVIENYGLEGLALQKAVVGAFVILNLLSIRKNGYQERAIWILRVANITLAAVSLLNLILPQLSK